MNKSLVQAAAEALLQQKSAAEGMIEVGAATLDRCVAKVSLPPEIVPITVGTIGGISKVRHQLIGAIVDRNPREYDDTPEAAVHLADDLLRLFNITSRA